MVGFRFYPDVLARRRDSFFIFNVSSTLFIQTIKYMKLIIITLAIFSSISVSGKKLWQEAVVIMRNDDTVNCNIDVYRAYQLAVTGYVRYKSDTGKFTIPAHTIHEILIDTVLYERISVIYNRYHAVNGYNRNDNFFGEILRKGNTSLYKYYHYAPDTDNKFTSLSGVGHLTPNDLLTYNSNVYSYFDMAYIIVRNGKIYHIGNKTFKYDMQAAFANCELILDKVKNKEFKYRNILEIVDFANQMCPDEHTPLQLQF